jgi:membrane-bound lytic murein transglycosylase D
MVIMKNVKFIVKLRRLIKSLAVSFIILFLGMAATAFKSEANDRDLKSTTSDNNPQTDKYGFKSLFSTNTFDPSKPYVTQLNPKAVPFVQKYIRENGENLEKMKVWGKPYLDLFDVILTQYGLPKELKYLSVIESDLSSNAVSRAGAVGPWQLMHETGTDHGLKINSRVDERRNFSKSTHAAAKLLKGLYSQFHDWLLVVAAYNCGDGRVRSAINKSGSKNFWDLQEYLPAETRNHVKRFIGTHYIFEGSGGLTTMTAAEVQDFDLNAIAIKAKQLSDSDDENANTGAIEISGRYNSSIIAKNVGVDLNLFNKLNPNFDKLISTGNIYTMRLPVEKVILFGNKKNNILAESIQFLLNSSSPVGQ